MSQGSEGVVRNAIRQTLPAGGASDRLEGRPTTRTERPSRKSRWLVSAAVCAARTTGDRGARRTFARVQRGTGTPRLPASALRQYASSKARVQVSGGR
jgi:hypothetical protein